MMIRCACVTVLVLTYGMSSAWASEDGNLMGRLNDIDGTWRKAEGLLPAIRKGISGQEKKHAYHALDELTDHMAILKRAQKAVQAIELVKGIQRVESLMQEKKFDDAQAAVNSLVVQYNTLAIVYYYKGICLQGKGEIRKAQDAYEEFLRRSAAAPDRGEGLTEIRTDAGKRLLVLSRDEGKATATVDVEKNPALLLFGDLLFQSTGREMSIGNGWIFSSRRDDGSKETAIGDFRLVVYREDESSSRTEVLNCFFRHERSRDDRQRRVQVLGGLVGYERIEKRKWLKLFFIRIPLGRAR